MDPSLRIQELEEQVQKLEVAKAEETKKASAAQRLKDASVKAVVAAESKIATLTCQVGTETQRATVAENRVLELEKQLDKSPSTEANGKADDTALEALETSIEQLKKELMMESERATIAEARMSELEGIQTAKDLETKRADAADALVVELKTALEQMQFEMVNERKQHRDSLAVADSCIAELTKAADEGEQYKEKLASAQTRIRELTREVEFLKMQEPQDKEKGISCIGNAENGKSTHDDVDEAYVGVSRDSVLCPPNNESYKDGNPNSSVSAQADTSFDDVPGDSNVHTVEIDDPIRLVDVQVEQQIESEDAQIDFLSKLDVMLREANLDDKLACALQWCGDHGCTSMQDIVASLDDFCRTLDLKPSQEKRVQRILQGGDDTVSVQLGHQMPTRIERPVDDTRKLEVTESTKIAWLSKFDAALQEAKLDSQRELAQQWCIEHGINCALDFKASVDAFTQELNLKPLQTKRLLRILQTDAMISPADPHPDTSTIGKGIPREATTELKSQPRGQPSELNKALTRTVSTNSKRSFAFLPPTADEATVPRNVRLRMHKTVGAGLDGHATWYGIVIDSIEDVPGQPDLEHGDCIIEIGGKSLQELDGGDCEAAFAAALRDGTKAVVETSCETCGELPASTKIDCSHMWKDLDAFALDYEVKFKILPGTRSLAMSGSRPAVAGARNAATTLINKWI